MLRPQDLNLTYRIKDVFWYPVWPPPVSWGDFYDAELYSHSLFSPEIGFVPLKLDLRAKWGRRKKQWNFFMAVFKKRVKSFSFLLMPVVYSMDREWERALL